MELGFLPAQDPGVFRPLLLPRAAAALSAGEPLTALALTEGTLAVGAAAGYLDGRRFLLISLYVAPEHRRQGGGRMLVEKLAELARPYAETMEVSFNVTLEEHKTLSPFLEKLGFTEEDDHGENIYLTTLGQVNHAFFSSSARSFGTPLSALNEGTISLIGRAALAADAPLPEGGVASADRELSMVFLSGSEPQAFVLVDSSSDALTLTAAWSVSHDPAVLPSLLRSAMTRALEKHPPETPLCTQAINPASAALVQKLLPGAVPISHSYTLVLHADEVETI